MTSAGQRLDYDQLQQMLGARDQRIRALERQLASSANIQQSDAREWQRLQMHRQDLGEWLVDFATNDSGIVVKPILDAGLGGELFVPCSFDAFQNERRYRLELRSTEYKVSEIVGNG